MAEKGSKYGDLIKQARQQDNQKTREPVDQQSGKPDDQMTSKPDEKMVNLCVKVPESLRRHWAAESKRSGVTMTDVIVEALSQKFGLPDNQTTR